MSSNLTQTQRLFRYRIFAVTGLAYAGFYFCRQNFSVVMPLLKTDLGFSNEKLAWVIFGYNLLYMIGQFANGVLADRWGPRLVVGLGLIIAISANMAMGLVVSLALFTVLGCLNGYGQSTGWPGLIKNMAAWFRHQERGVVMAWWTTCYVLGGFAAKLFATKCVSSPTWFPGLGWRRGFWGPALVLTAVAAVYILFTRNKPADAGLPVINEDESEPPVGPPAAPGAVSNHSWRLFRQVLSSPAVWTIGAMYFFLKLTRYSFLFWLPMYMTDQLHYSVKEAGYTSAAYELVGFFGTITAGYLSDKLFQARRFPVGSIMLFGLAVACFIHPRLAALGWVGNVIGISIIGFMTYGPDTLMTGAGAMDVGSQSGAATAAGVINGMGSCGQLFSSLLVARMADRLGWNSIFLLFVVCALAGAVLLATKWNYGGQPRPARAV
ncbi:MAG: MFS transporter [Limisphaerales bacterium]